MDPAFESEDFINLGLFLPELKFTKLPNLFIISIGSMFVNNDVPEIIFLSGVKFVLFAFTNLVLKELNGTHYVASVRNPNGSWYFYDDEQLVDVKPSIAALIANHPLMYEESNFEGAAKVDTRNILFYLKDPQDPIPAPLTKPSAPSTSEKSKAGELEDVREIPWDQNLPNPKGKNDCWFNSVLQVMLRLDCAKDIVHERLEASSSKYLMELQGELIRMFQEKDYFSKLDVSGRSSARCNAAIERKYKFNQYQQEGYFLDDILKLEPFKRETRFVLDFKTEEEEQHVYFVGTDDDFKERQFKTSKHIPELKKRVFNHNGDVTYIQLTNFLPIISFTIYPNIFIIDLGRCFINGGVPEFFKNGSVYYSLFGFTIMHDKSDLGTHYSAVVKRKDNNWYSYDDRAKHVKRYGSYNASLEDIDLNIFHDTKFQGKVDQRSILVYIKRDPETGASDENDSDEDDDMDSVDG